MEEEQQFATWSKLNTHQQPDREVGHPSQWVECTSESGDLYYTNMLTGDTSWTKPGSEPDVDENGAALWETAKMQADAAVHENYIVTHAGEGVQWLELDDPAQNAAYYFAPQSGEIRWEPPLEDTALVHQCDSDRVLSTIVSLQSAARSQQARAKVNSMRQQKLMEHERDENSVRDPNAEASDEVPTDTVQSSQEVQNVDPQWMEVYHPVTQQQYYYSPRSSKTRWDPPDAFVVSSYDRQVAAVISIQSLSRGRRARKQVHELRAHSPLHEEQLSLNFEVDYSEHEAVSRREMNHQELLQLKGGDRFWGVDNYKSEELQKHIEDQLLVRANSMNKNVSSANYHQINAADTQQVEEQEFEDTFEEIVDSELLQRELQDEYDARIAMTHEEAQQCHNRDKFWGIQAEEVRQNAANMAMTEEEAASRSFADTVVEQALSAAWETEVQQNARNELATRGGQEQRMQVRYLRWFYRQCVSVDELLNHRWPTKQQQEGLEETPSPVKRRRHVIPQPYCEFIESATPYPLDDLVVRERLENGDLRYGLRSILTVHHQSARGTNGTHFEITTAPLECAFDETIAAALSKSQTLADKQVDSEERDGFVEDGSQEGELTPGSSVNYRRSRMPDPHIPARFNGVPYKPNQISPIREILSGDHRKLNQLPSLSKPQPSVQTPKIHQVLKAKAKTRATAKTSRVPTPSTNDKHNPEWVHERDDNEHSNPPEEDPRAQFKRQEHHVLSKLFALMDLDGSGTVNQNEMRWALQRDAEIHALAKTSPLFQLLLKQRTRLEDLFTSQTGEWMPESNVEVSPRAGNSNELLWDEFLVRCENSYFSLMAEGLIQPDVVAQTHFRGAYGKRVVNSYHDDYMYSDQATRDREAKTIRRVFALLDVDHNGILDVGEVQRVMYDSAAKIAYRSGTESTELRALVEGSKALQPILHHELFMTAFAKFEPLDPRGISEEEFVAFCLEIAHVAAANSMEASEG